MGGQRNQQQLPKKRGPYALQIDDAMQYAYEYLENSNDECQFSFEELMKLIKGDFVPDPKTVKAKLMEKYGQDIIFSSNRKMKTIICFRNAGEKILNDSWYQQKCKSEADERLRVVEAAAKIICDDIRSQVYEVKAYPAPDSFLEEVESVIPETLNYFLHILTMLQNGFIINVKLSLTALLML